MGAGNTHEAVKKIEQESTTIGAREVASRNKKEEIRCKSQRGTKLPRRLMNAES